MTWPVYFHSDAQHELERLPIPEQDAILNAAKKLESQGQNLGYPHSSSVIGATDLRELRPRAGRSRWRALYRMTGEVFVIAAIGPEAQVNKKGFQRAIAAAESRLDENGG